MRELERRIAGLEQRLLPQRPEFGVLTVPYGADEDAEIARQVAADPSLAEARRLVVVVDYADALHPDTFSN